MMTRIWLATRNRHKTAEFRELLGREFLLEDLLSHPEIAEPIEDGGSFLENARIKALTVSRQLPGLVLADDSGLEVGSLGGAPGIYSARYAGADATDLRNRQKLLENLRGEKNRQARFRCVLVLARAGEEIGSCDGAIEGTITQTERGAAGFGYDSIFLPENSERTFAEFSAAEKNLVSHRAQAAMKLRQLLPKAALPRA